MPVTTPLNISSIATMYGAADPRRKLLTQALTRADRADTFRHDWRTRADGRYDTFEDYDFRKAVSAGTANLRPAEVQAAQVFFDVIDQPRIASSASAVTEAEYLPRALDGSLDFSRIHNVYVDGIDRSADVLDLVERLASTPPGERDGVHSVKTTELLRALHDPYISPEERPLLLAAIDLVVRSEVTLPNTTDSTGTVATELRVRNRRVDSEAQVGTEPSLVLRAPPGSTLVMEERSLEVPASGELVLPLGLYSTKGEGFVFAPVADTEAPKLLHRFEVPSRFRGTNVMSPWTAAARIALGLE